MGVSYIFFGSSFSCAKKTPELPCAIHLPFDPTNTTLPTPALSDANEMSGKTVVHDPATGKTYVGSFSPNGRHTAHVQLGVKAGVDLGQAVGGSIKHDSNGYHMGQRSESLNAQNFGSCKVHGNKLGAAKKNLQAGNYYTVSQNGSVNKGQKQWELE